MSRNGDYELFDLSLDRLDEYWLEQSRLYHEHAVKLADAKEQLNRAKAEKALKEAELEEIVATIDRDIRRDPTAFGFDGDKKPTEGAIHNAILIDNRYKVANSVVLEDATNEVIESQHLVDVLYATVSALDQRKESLQDLVKLEGRDYFSTPRAAAKPDRERMDEVAKERAFGAKRKAKQK